MAFAIYPDVDTAALLGKPALAPINLAAGEEMAVFAPLAALIGPGSAMHLRIAVSGSPVPAGAQPTIELLAQEPDAFGGDPRKIDPNVAINLATAVPISGGLAPVAARAHFTPPYTDNVYRLTVVIDVAGTKLWIRITNTTGIARDFVWVVADNEAETRQPWIHATLGNAVPANIAFEAVTGETRTAQPIAITNRGTGPMTVPTVAPPLGAPYSLTGLPAVLGPNPAAPAQVRISFHAPGDPGQIPPASFSFVTADKLDPGPFGPGHNNAFSLSARAVPPPGHLRVPDLSGKNNSDCIAAIHAAGFKARILGLSSLSGVGLCTKQKPLAGKFIRAGERVRAYMAAPVVSDGQALHDDDLGSGTPLPGDWPPD